MKKLGLTIAAITCVYGSAYGKMETYIGLQGGYTISTNKGKDVIEEVGVADYTAKSSFKANHGTLGLFAEIHNDIGGTNLFWGAGLSADGHFGHKPKDLEFADANGALFDGGQAAAQPSKTTYKSRWSIQPYLSGGYKMCNTKFFMTVGVPITQFNVSPHSGYADAIPFESFKKTLTGLSASFNVQQNINKFFVRGSIGYTVYKKIDRIVGNEDTSANGGPAADTFKYYSNTQPRSVDMKLAVGMKI